MAKKISKIWLSIICVLVISFGIFFSIDFSYAEEKVDIVADTAIVYLEDTDEILWSKDLNFVTDLASTTKLMTVMVSLDYVDIDETVEFNGKSLSIYELLHYVLIESNNDAAVCLANYVAKITGLNFVELMNTKASEFGCEHTIYYNPSGLYDENMSCISDLVLIAKNAFNNELIREIASKSKYTTKDGYEIISTNQCFFGFKIKNGNGETVEIEPIPEVICGKTGTFGHYGDYHANIVTLCNIEGMNVYIALMDSTYDNRYPDYYKLFNLAKSLVNPYIVFNENDTFIQGKIWYGKTNVITGCAKKTGVINLPEGISLSLVTTEVVYFNDLKAPINKGDVIGEIKIFIADEYIKSIELVSSEDIEKGWFLSRFRITNKQTIIILGILVFIFLTFISLSIIRANNKKKAKLARQKKIREAALKELEREKSREDRNWKY